MARGRFLNRSIRHDRRLNSVSVEAEYLFLKCIPHLDRDGIAAYDTLWADTMPLRPEMQERIPYLVQELVVADLVVLYDTDEGAALFFPGFNKNQPGLIYKREAPSRFPLPTSCNHHADTDDELATNSRLDHDKVATNSDKTLPKARARSQVKDQVEVEVEGDAATAAAVSPEEAEETVIAAWQTNEMGGKAVGLVRDALCELTRQHGTATMLQAIAIACERDRRTLGYVRGILRKGVNTPSNGASPPGASPYAGMVLERDEDDEP